MVGDYSLKNFRMILLNQKQVFTCIFYDIDFLPKQKQQCLGDLLKRKLTFWKTFGWMFEKVEKS